MIRVGTTFSGIGAVEHALQRMGVEHKLIFACDNGGINIFAKKIEDRYKPIEKELSYLHGEIAKISDVLPEDKKALAKKTEDISHHYNTAKDKINKTFPIDPLRNTVLHILNILKEDGDRNFRQFYENQTDLDISDVLFLCTELKKNKKVKELAAKEDLENLEHCSKDKIYRSSRRAIKHIVQQLSQLHESIETLKINSKLAQMDSFEDKNNYIQKLYAPKEKSNFVKKSYLHNYKLDPKHFHWNISFLDGRQYRHKIDLYVGGSPCQSFSIVGKRGGFNDTRGTLFYDYVRILKESEPRFFIYENVKGVLNHDNGRTWKVMQNTFRETGYLFKSYVLNAKDFGIPQHRERLFVIGFRREEDYNRFKDPEGTKLQTTMKDFLEDNVNEKYYLPQKGLKFVTDTKNLKKKYTQINGDLALCQKANQQFNWHGDFVEEYNELELEKMSKIEDKYSPFIWWLCGAGLLWAKAYLSLMTQRVLICFCWLPFCFRFL
jgi:DNA (cytosine-5)-methyltransferase 1